VSVLDDMEAEHQRIDPLLAAVDAGFASAAEAGAGLPHPDLLADAVDTLAAALTGQLPPPARVLYKAICQRTRGPDVRPE
jgi:hypothetical protein